MFEVALLMSQFILIEAAVGLHGDVFGAYRLSMTIGMLIIFAIQAVLIASRMVTARSVVIPPMDEKHALIV